MPGIQVADNGVPSLSATQSFAISVNPLLPPTAGAPFWSGGRFQFQVEGDFGPDYLIQLSTNLSSRETGARFGGATRLSFRLCGPPVTPTMHRRYSIERGWGRSAANCGST